MRIEIDIRDDIPSELALEAVREVIKEGRISEGERGRMYYCWATTFDTIEGKIAVFTKQYTKNDCFIVSKEK